MHGLEINRDRYLPLELLLKLWRSGEGVLAKRMVNDITMFKKECNPPHGYQNNYPAANLPVHKNYRVCRVVQRALYYKGITVKLHACQRKMPQGRINCVVVTYL